MASIFVDRKYDVYRDQPVIGTQTMAHHARTVHKEAQP